MQTRWIVPFPQKITSYCDSIKKSYEEKSRLDREIQNIKDKLRALIQGNFPIIPSSPFMEPAQRQYMTRYFGAQALGQNWQRNIAIQELLMKLSQLEMKRKDLE